MKIELIAYSLSMRGLTRPLRLAAVADFHNGIPEAVCEALEGVDPEAVLLPGDFLHKTGETERGFALLSHLAARYPTYCSLGNHEVKCDLPDLAERIKETGAVLLDNDTATLGELTVGGLSTGYRRGMLQRRTHPTPPPDRLFLSQFSQLTGAKLLLCHHPEYYPRYIREKEIPLTVSGHAHGGQWVLFGHAIFAPGQGLFPPFSAGLYEDRLIVSRGLGGGPALVPRIGNPYEISVIDLWPQ